MIGAVLHTLNIRLFHDQLTYIVNHAADRFIFVDRSLLPVIRKLAADLRRRSSSIVVMDDGGDVDARRRARLRDTCSSSGAEHCDFPRLDENDAAMMCYTSGTTGNPKGVAYSHRALTLHSFGECMSTPWPSRERDTVMAMVPMFHANAWGLPYASTLVGAKQVFPGNAMTPDRVLQLDAGRAA